jgi:hypothetical protein
MKPEKNSNFLTLGVGLLCYFLSPAICRPYGRIFGQLERIWKEMVMTAFTYCPASCLECVRKAMRTLS